MNPAIVPSTPLLEDLLFRRQFLLGPFRPDTLNTQWQGTPLFQGLTVWAHPDLPVIQYSSEATNLTLLGYILDPIHPEKNDEEVLAHVIQQLAEGKSVFEATYFYGGRWIIIEESPHHVRLFQDPGGLRTLVYTQHGGQMWCASQAGLLAYCLGLRLDEKIQNEVLDTETFKKIAAHWLPGTLSYVQGVYHLIPNHYLDFSTAASKRFWPRKQINPIGLMDSVTRVTDLMKGLVEALQNRHSTLGAAVTSGSDSRVVLAASKNIAHKTYYYTFVSDYCELDSPDITVSGRLLNRLRLTHHLIDCRNPHDKSFESLYYQSLSGSRKVSYPLVEGQFYSEYPQNAITMGGMGGEVGKLRYRDPGITMKLEDVDSMFLTRTLGFGENLLIEGELAKWLLQVPLHGAPVMDLLHWEHNLGRWSAQGIMERDLVHDYFSPFNCREIYALMLACDERYRHPSEETYQTLLAANLWPESLLEPINPHKRGLALPRMVQSRNVLKYKCDKLEESYLLLKSRYVKLEEKRFLSRIKKITPRSIKNVYKRLRNKLV